LGVGRRIATALAVALAGAMVLSLPARAAVTVAAGNLGFHI